MNRHTTKEHLADTFIDLLKSNGIEEVSVSKLCKKSNVSRETFYYHFKDKYDLIEWIYCSQKRMILDKYYGTEPWSETIVVFCP